jgi:2,5-diketo-D-gluconate reductase B
MTGAIPAIGLGTWGLTGSDGVAVMRMAIELGYRHLDTAQTYDTEAGIADAIAQAHVPRDEMFLTTKIADTRLSRSDLLPSLRESLRRLGVEQVDLTLIHWPSHRDRVPLAEYLEGLAEAKAIGLTRLIGVSNFPSAHVERAVGVLGPGQIATNQVELHPFLQSHTLQAACARHGIPITAYIPLARGAVLAEPAIERIARRHGATASAVVLAWHRQQGRIAIPSSTRREHLAGNLDSRRVSLPVEDLAAIDALERGARIINPDKSPAWD